MPTHSKQSQLATAATAFYMSAEMAHAVHETECTLQLCFTFEDLLHRLLMKNANTPYSAHQLILTLFPTAALQHNEAKHPNGMDVQKEIDFSPSGHGGTS
jgi:hypothetical protein